MIVITTVIAIIIQLTILSFLLVSFIEIGAFGLVKLGQLTLKGFKIHIKKEGQTYQERAIIPKYRVKNIQRSIEKYLTIRLTTN